jgi:hypothetical protein
MPKVTKERTSNETAYVPLELLREGILRLAKMPDDSIIYICTDRDSDETRIRVSKYTYSNEEL